MWKKILISNNKHSVGVAERDGKFIAKCLTCDWKGPLRDTVTPASNDRKDHLGLSKRASSNPKINFIIGDITRQKVDAIVNAANESLLGGGGVDGAIHDAGGSAILDACKKLRKTTHPKGLPVGEAVSTTGGNLWAPYVIHTVGPRYDQSVDSSSLLANSHVNSLKEADRLGARSIAFPAISTGIYGYPIEEAAPVALRAIRSTPTNVENINFVFLDEKTRDVYKRALDNIS